MNAIKVEGVFAGDTSALVNEGAKLAGWLGYKVEVGKVGEDGSCRWELWRRWGSGAIFVVYCICHDVGNREQFIIMSELFGSGRTNRHRGERSRKMNIFIRRFRGVWLLWTDWHDEARKRTAPQGSVVAVLRYTCLSCDSDSNKIFSSLIETPILRLSAFRGELKNDLSSINSDANIQPFLPLALTSVSRSISKIQHPLFGFYLQVSFSITRQFCLYDTDKIHLTKTVKVYMEVYKRRLTNLGNSTDHGLGHPIFELSHPRTHKQGVYRPMKMW